MTIEQWLFHYKLIVKKEEESSKLKFETIRAVADQAMDFAESLFERNAETIGYFVDRPEYFKYQERKKEYRAKKEAESKIENPVPNEVIDTKEKFDALPEDKRLELEFDYLMSDAFPSDVKLDVNQGDKKKTVLKTTKKRFVGIQQRMK